MIKIIVNLQIACQHYNYLPKKSNFKTWINQIFQNNKKNKEITIRLIEKSESKKLNFIYRGINKPTNILTFLYNVPLYKNYTVLGDLAICSTIIKEESIKQNKKIEAHWAHIVIHGGLHLLGYTHDNRKTAKKMESIETMIINSLGYNNPY